MSSGKKKKGGNTYVYTSFTNSLLKLWFYKLMSKIDPETWKDGTEESQSEGVRGGRKRLTKSIIIKA